MKNKTFIFFLVLLSALICFEVFNFDTTRYGLRYFFGDLSFMGIEWVMWLAVAACAADMVGMLRIFTEETNFKKESVFIVAATGVWILAATINAILTWWTTTLIVLQGDIGNEVVSRNTLVVTVPVLVAIFVWLLRIGSVATLASMGDKVLHGIKLPMKKAKPVTSSYRPAPTYTPTYSAARKPPVSQMPIKTFSVEADADKSIY